MPGTGDEASWKCCPVAKYSGCVPLPDEWPDGDEVGEVNGHEQCRNQCARCPFSSEPTYTFDCSNCGNCLPEKVFSSTEKCQNALCNYRTKREHVRGQDNCCGYCWPPATTVTRTTTTREQVLCPTDGGCTTDQFCSCKVGYNKKSNQVNGASGPCFSCVSDQKNQGGGDDSNGKVNKPSDSPERHKPPPSGNNYGGRLTRHTPRFL